ncbi:hypothetical protein K1719_035908 [Acacia pycnantha]|nr:hypothetical protein K1719_035908 [Acacia pycnantha]
MVATGKTSAVLPLSKEEDDLLMRSSKKVRNEGDGNGNNLAQASWPSPESKEAVYCKGGMSFVENLKGKDGIGDSSDDELVKDTGSKSDDQMSEDEGGDKDSDPLYVVEEDTSRNFPTFTFSDKVKRRLYKAWRKAVIVKLIDKSIGYKALLSRLQTLWAKKGVLSLIDIGYGFYVVKMTNRDDYINALTGVPWMIYDHYLTIRPWELNFVLAKAKIDKVQNSEDGSGQGEKTTTEKTTV